MGSDHQTANGQLQQRPTHPRDAGLRAQGNGGSTRLDETRMDRRGFPQGTARRSPATAGGPQSLRSGDGRSRRLSPRSRRMAMQEMLKKCSPFARGEEVRDLLPIPLSREPTKAEIKLSTTCARGQPVSPELIQEAAVDVWIQCHQGFVTA